MRHKFLDDACNIFGQSSKYLVAFHDKAAVEKF